MRAEKEEVILVIETGTVIVIVITIEGESGTDIENGTRTVRDPEIGMVEAVGMEEEGLIGDIEMEEMEAGTGTVIVAGHDLLLGKETGLLEVQFTHISETVDRLLSFEIE